MQKSTTHRVLGLDPGSLYTGYGVLEGSRSRWKVVAQGRWVLGSGPLAQRLVELGVQVEAGLREWEPDVAVLETPFLGRSSRSLIVLAQARGALMFLVARAGLPIVEYAPAEVKQAVTGNGRAEKVQVARMVALLLGLPKAPVADAADALAVALCFGARSGQVGAGAGVGSVART